MSEEIEKLGTRMISGDFVNFYIAPPEMGIESALMIGYDLVAIERMPSRRVVLINEEFRESILKMLEVN